MPGRPFAVPASRCGRICVELQFPVPFRTSRVGTGQMMQPLSPTCDVARLEAELSLVPHVDREEAVQEVWLAHLSGRRPYKQVCHPPPSGWANQQSGPPVALWPKADAIKP